MYAAGEDFPHRFPAAGIINAINGLQYPDRAAF